LHLQRKAREIEEKREALRLQTEAIAEEQRKRAEEVWTTGLPLTRAPIYPPPPPVYPHLLPPLFSVVSLLMPPPPNHPPAPLCCSQTARVLAEKEAERERVKALEREMTKREVEAQRAAQQARTEAAKRQFEEATAARLAAAAAAEVRTWGA
jgi:cell division septum initiation protein DivIVA